MTKTIIYFWIASIIICSAATGMLVYNYMDKPISQPVTTAVDSKPIDRPTNKLTLEEAIGVINHYDKDKINIKWKILDQTGNTLHVRIDGNLYERNFNQEAFLPVVVESKNWKLGLGFGFGMAAAGGLVYLGYKFLK